MLTPAFESASIMGCIGRLSKPFSPVIVPFPANAIMGMKKRAVEPLSWQFIGEEGGFGKHPSISRQPFCLVTFAPNARTASIVALMSSDSRKPRMRDFPSAREAHIIARCEYDFEGGAKTEPETLEGDTICCIKKGWKAQLK